MASRRCAAEAAGMEALEEKAAWLEAQLDDQGREIKALQDRLMMMEKAFRMLASKMQDPYATRSLDEEVPPPHY
ncbi:MAG: SlyX family protein [Succinivibrio sp.]